MVQVRDIGGGRPIRSLARRPFRQTSAKRPRRASLPSVSMGDLQALRDSLSRFPKRSPSSRTRATENGLIPDRIANVLATYPSRPAEWLVGRSVRPASQEDIDLLARALLEAISDGHRESVIKCLSIWSNVQAGTLSTNAETVQLLQMYPNDPRTRAMADTAVRGMWGAQKALIDKHEDESHFAEAIEWAKVFWGVNSMTTRSTRRREIEAEREAQGNPMTTPSNARSAASSAAPGTPPEGGARAGMSRAGTGVYAPGGGQTVAESWVDLMLDSAVSVNGKPRKSQRPTHKIAVDLLAPLYGCYF
jgi:hypothetical protein